MPRPKGSVNRKTRGVVQDPAPEKRVQGVERFKEREQKAELNKRDPEEIKAIDGEVLNEMSRTNRMRLTHSDTDSLTLRQKQAAGAEYLASLVGHPEYRRRLLEESLKDPVSVLKIASSERPKEIHLEADIQHSVVVVPTQQTAAEWDAAVKVIEGETIQGELWGK